MRFLDALLPEGSRIQISHVPNIRCEIELDTDLERRKQAMRMNMWVAMVLWQAAVLCLTGSHECHGAVITPVGVIATSEFGAVDIFGDGNFSDVFVTDLIDGGGLNDVSNTPDNILDDVHDFDFSSTNGWHAGDFAAGIPGGLDGDNDPLTAPDVTAQIIEFELGGLFELNKAHVWQQNQGIFFFPPAPAEARGVDEFEILTNTASTGDDFTLLGKFRLQPETGLEEVPAQMLAFAQPVNARRVRFHFLSSISGEPNEFIGLSEVRFEGTSLGILGDFNGDGDLSAEDINLLSAAVRAGGAGAEFDVNSDGAVNFDDRNEWVRQLKQTYFGDSNLDGVFDSGDFVFAFQAGQYEDGVPSNSLWETGDWNGDGEFDSGDFVIAFQSEGFEKGPRPPFGAAAVPEPAAFVSLAIGALLLGAGRVRRVTA